MSKDKKNRKHMETLKYYHLPFKVLYKCAKYLVRFLKEYLIFYRLINTRSR
jgi:hypothetical protein